MKFNPSEILNKINSELQNTPDEISINVILTGIGAKKFHLVKTIVSNTNPEFDEEEIYKYIIRSGIEREMEKISKIWKND
jgi:hypothetical protein